jgi:hypothetical protein
VVCHGNHTIQLSRMLLFRRRIAFLIFTESATDKRQYFLMCLLHCRRGQDNSHVRAAPQVLPSRFISCHPRVVCDYKRQKWVVVYLRHIRASAESAFVNMDWSSSSASVCVLQISIGQPSPPNQVGRVSLGQPTV